MLFQTQTQRPSMNSLAFILSTAFTMNSRPKNNLKKIEKINHSRIYQQKRSSVSGETKFLWHYTLNYGFILLTDKPTLSLYECETSGGLNKN